MLKSTNGKGLCCVSLVFVFLSVFFVAECFSSGISDKPFPSSNQDRLAPVPDTNPMIVKNPNMATAGGIDFNPVVHFILNHFQGISLLILLSVIPAMLIAWNREKTLIQ